MEQKFVRVNNDQTSLNCFIDEIWMIIKDFPSYMVSNYGRVKSLNYLNKKKERIIKPFLCKCGYLYIRLCKNGFKKKFRVHRLVAMAFIPNPNNYPVINHKNEIKTDNRVNNLEWTTHLENANYGNRNRKISISKKKCVLQFSLDDEFIKRWDSALQVEKELGYGRSNISSCCRGLYNTAYGYKWKYEQS